jgi:hypothetical protein
MFVRTPRNGAMTMTRFLKKTAVSFAVSFVVLTGIHVMLLSATATPLRTTTRPVVSALPVTR